MIQVNGEVAIQQVVNISLTLVDDKPTITSNHILLSICGKEQDKK